MRRFQVCIIFSLLIFTKSLASVTFNFIYNDTKNKVDPKTLQTIDRNISRAGSLVGDALDHNANVQIAVNFGSLGRALASASSRTYVLKQKDENGLTELDFVVRKKIVSGDDENGNEPDGNVSINADLISEFTFDDAVTRGKDDFIATIMHELTHTLGFNSIAGSRIENVNIHTGKISAYTFYDAFLVDSEGRHLVKEYQIDAGLNKLIPYTRFYFDGKNAREANGGKPVPLRIRDNSHVEGYLLSDEAPGKMVHGQGETVGSVMTGGTVYHQRLPRKWSKIERAMLMDLGYKVKNN